MSIFGSTLGSIFGGIFGSTGSGGGGGGGGITLPDETPFIDASIAFLCEQFKDRPNIIALLTALLGPAQQLSNVMSSAQATRSVFTAVGIYLDRLGKIVGQVRGTLDDDTYRRYILARIAANRSSSSTENLINVARLVLGSTAPTNVQISVQTQQNATAVVDLFNMIPGQALANVLFTFLNVARAAGVRLILQTRTAVPTQTFTTALETFSFSSLSIGDTHINTNGAIGNVLFPASGSLDLDIGTTVAETVTYTSKLANQFLGVSALTQNHGAGCSIQLTSIPLEGFDLVAQISSTVTAGDTTINVDSTSGFASSGSITIDPTGTSETITYSGKTSTSFTGLVAGSGHAIGVLIEPSPDVTGGKFISDQDLVL